MAERIRLFIQKRTSLKGQFTTFSNLLDKGKVDNATVKLRMARLTDLYHAFEEINDELAIADPNDSHHEEFLNIQERFYNIAGRVENLVNVANTLSNHNSEETRIENVEGRAIVRKRRIKLPEATLPTFDGKFENWLSFKNSFSNMIGSQLDLSDVDKLHYLRSALKGEAASKIRIFEIDGINYIKAWELLERSYEVKQILISRHLSFILHLPALERESTSGLTRLVDDMQQHVASLNTLGVSVGSEMLIHLLETRLPKVTLERWKATLDRDEFLKVEELYEFIYRTAVCVSRRERTDTEGVKSAPPVKKRRPQPTNHTFLTNTNSRNCAICKVKRHPLYLCEKFKKLPVRERINTVRNAKLCYNCLRSHRDSPCKFSNCPICQKRHNALLHIDDYNAASKSPPTKTNDSNEKVE